VLEQIFQPNLYSPARCDCVDRFAKSGRLEETNWDTKVCAVDEIENINPQGHFVTVINCKVLDDGQIQVEHVAGAETITVDTTVLTDGRKHACRVAGGQLKRLLAVVSDRYATSVIKTIGQVAIEINVKDGVDRKRLSRLKLAGARNL
jgi:hypothetical protein